MNMVNIDPEEFQKSITNELNIIKDRVENLIRNSHFGEQGRYREAILRNVIKRFLPSNLSLGTGFIVQKSKNGFNISSQIDIIIYDNTIPPLFSEGDFIITIPESAKGIIEVKSKIRNCDLDEILRKAKENGKLIGKEKFNGIFGYEYHENVESTTVKRTLRENKGYVNHISLGKDYFIRFWKCKYRKILDPPVNCNSKSDFYNVYEIEDLSFSYFISNLLHKSCDKKLGDRSWFSFPIKETKEIYRLYTICIDNY